MAHQTPIARWMLNNRARVNPSFTRFEWPERYFSGLSDFSSAILIDGIAATGRGLDLDPELALEKASAEAIERYICRAFKINSVGLAVSGEPDSTDHAKREALERYFFSLHRKKKRPFASLTTIELRATGQIADVFHSQNGNIGCLSFFRMAAPNPFHGLVALITSNDAPISLGLSLHVDAAQAARSAFYEALANFAIFRDDPVQFERERCSNADYWTCDSKFLSSLQNLFASPSQDADPFKLPTLMPMHLDLTKLTALHDCPIAPVKFIAQEAP